MLKFFFHPIQHFIERSRIGNNKFIIVSNNCFGSELYSATKRNYNTPFVGLILYPDCYIRFLKNFNQNINKKLSFSKNSKYFKNQPLYPVGKIGNDIEIHFIHYSSENEALSKWSRRANRLIKDFKKNYPMFIKLCDRDGCTETHLINFHKLKLGNKISLGVKNFNNKNHITIPYLKDKKGQYVIDGYALFKKRYKFIDFANWIMTKEIKKTFISKFLSFFS